MGRNLNVAPLISRAPRDSVPVGAVWGTFGELATHILIATSRRSLCFLIKALSCLQAEADGHYCGAKHSKAAGGAEINVCSY